MSGLDLTNESSYTCALYSTPVPHAIMRKNKMSSGQPYEVPVDTKSNCYMSISSDYVEPLFDDSTDDYSVPKDALKSFKKQQRLNRNSMHFYIKPARELKALLSQFKRCEVKSIQQNDIRYIHVNVSHVFIYGY